MTTIITTISLSLAGLIIGILASYGLKLPIDQQSLAGVIGLIIFFVFSIINAKYKSTYFTDNDEIRFNVAGLTPAQIDAIQNFIDNAVDMNIKQDIDPASEYEDDTLCQD